MFPRFLITLDSDLKELPVTVRVGQVRSNMAKDSLYSSHFTFPTQGGRRGWPGWEAKDNIRVPDAPDTSANGHYRAR